MKRKSRCFGFMLILCILFTITCVSPIDDNQTEIISDDETCGSFEELNQSISESDVELNLTKDYKYDK